MDQYVYLHSNFDAMTYFGKPNKIGQFKNQLSSPLPINQNTKVALAEIVYTKSWYNVEKVYEIRLVDQSSQVLVFPDLKLKVNRGFYDTPESLVKDLNQILGYFPIKQPPMLQYNARENYVYLYAGKTDTQSVYPDFGEEIENILGLRNRNTYVYEYNNIPSDGAEYDFHTFDHFDSNVLKGYHPVEINAGIHHLMVYSDIVSESFNGATKSQLLGMVKIPPEAKFGDTVHIRYKDRNFKPVNYDQFQCIEISVRDSSNREIPFKFGLCSVKLQFTTPI